MAEKESNSTKNTATKTASKSAAKSTAAETKTTAKQAASAKTAATEKSATTAKTTAAETKTTAKQTASTKTATAEKSAATTAKTTAAETKTTAKQAASTKTATAEKPAAATATAAASKPKKTAAAQKAEPVEKQAAAKEKAVKEKDTKIAKAAKTTESTEKSQSGFISVVKSKAAVIAKNKNYRIIAISVLSVFLAFFLLLGLILGLKSCTGVNGILRQSAVNVNAYSQTTVVGYSTKTVGTVDRYRPVEEIRDDRDRFSLGITVADDARYPKYGYTMNSVVGEDPDGSKSAARQVLINESDYLSAYGTYNNSGNGGNGDGTYNMMDKDGYLYFVNNGTTTPATYDDGTPRQLYKHTASVGLYLGDVSDDEPGIIKQVTLRPRGYSSYSVTGVYACAGEVIKIQLSGADMNATNGITIHIGQALYNGQSNNIWAAKGQMQRFPNILNTMVVNKNTAVYDEATDTWTAYVGSFLGGPLYVRNTAATVTVTISGGVAYRHFILGYTTPKEFEELSKSSAPYFDLEVWDRGVLHSGPLTYADEFNYDQLYDAAVLWEKVSIVSNANGIGSNCYNQGIVFLYDPFVAAGAAVAFPGRSSVNCPMGWMSSSLNYSAIVTSGSWGNFHEYNHNFQNYGIGYTGEVTNNGLNLVSYSLFTKISSARQMESYGGAGLSGWNCYTSATWAQQRVKTNNISSTSGLAVYATLLHNFGQEAFLNARGYSGVNYFNRWAEVTHYDFSYFDQNTTAYSGGPLNPAETEYPLFVPISSVYQTGRTYNYNGEKREFTTMQPYIIPYGKSFTVDLTPYTVNAADQYESGSVLIGASTNNDFYYKIKSVNAKGINGKFVKTGDGIYTFTPNSEMLSGKIYVTLEIYNAADDSRVWNGHALDDVDLILEFQQSHEWNKAILERTTYTFSESTMYTDAQTAFENNFKGYTATTGVYDHSNPTQNANTDIWYCTEETLSKFPNADPELHVVKANTIDLLSGKLYFEEDGKYRVYLRGRLNCALFFSLNNKDYTLGAKIADNNTDYRFRLTDPNTYFDIEFEKGKCTVWIYVGSADESGHKLELQTSGENWLYIKEVLVNVKINSSMAGFIGVGYAQWTVPLYTTQTKYYDSNGNEVSADSEDIARTETLYFDASGHQVTAEQASNVDPIPPTSALYATAYRNDYAFQKEFESDYFFIRPINYNYIEPPVVVTKDKVITPTEDCNYAPWFDYQVWENLFDGDYDTEIHFSSAWGVSTSKPAILAFDLGETVTANSIKLYTNRNANGNNKGFPRDFTLEGSLDGITYFDMGTWNGVGQPSVSIELTFNDMQTFDFRYFRLTVTSTSNGRVSLAEIEFNNTFRLMGNGNNFFSPDDEMFTYKGDWKVESCSANFGHVYVGKKATMEFQFEGTYFAILASKLYGQNYKVYIDGKVVESLAVKEDDGDYAVAYLSPELKDKKHKVVIYCQGEANIDSIVTW